MMTGEPTFQDFYCRRTIADALVRGGARQASEPDLVFYVIEGVRNAKREHGVVLSMGSAFLFAGESPDLVADVVRSLRDTHTEHFFLDAPW